MRMEAEEAPAVLEFNSVPVIFADGIASALLVGNNVRITFYERRLLDGKEVRVAVLELVRPLASCLELSLQAMLQAQMTLGVN